MAKNPKIELPLRNDFGILCDPKIAPQKTADTVCFTLPNLIVIALFGGMIGGLACAVAALWLPTVLDPDHAAYLLIPFAALLVVVLFGAIYYWGVVSRRHIRRYGDKFIVMHLFSPRHSPNKFGSALGLSKTFE